MKCADCRFYEKIFGNCRRLPPVPVYEHTRFPRVSENDWCGEFKKREAPKQVEMFPKDKKGTRLTKEWQLDAEIGNWAVQQGLKPEEVLAEEEKFRDYWISVPGQKGIKLDWDATWRNHIRNAIKWKNERPVK